MLHSLVPLFYDLALARIYSKTVTDAMLIAQQEMTIHYQSLLVFQIKRVPLSSVGNFFGTLTNSALRRGLPIVLW